LVERKESLPVTNEELELMTLIDRCHLMLASVNCDVVQLAIDDTLTLRASKKVRAVRSIISTVISLSLASFVRGSVGSV